MAHATRAAAVMTMLVLFASRAYAQPDPPAQVAPADSSPGVEQARRLVEEGRVLGSREDWSGALAKFREAARLAESPALRFNIAMSEEHLGKLVAALTDFRLAQREAARGGAPEVSAGVEARIAAIEPRIASFAFQRPRGSERATVLVDGAPLGDPASGRLEVDPGPHRVTALLDGVTRYDRAFRLAEGESLTVSLVLAPLPVALPAPRPPVLGYVLGGVGLVSLGVMGVFLGLRQGAIADLGDCEGLHCPAGSGPAIDRGRTFTGVAEVTGVVGLVALVTGIVLVARAPSAGSARKQGNVPVVVRVSANGLHAAGAF